MSRPLFTISLTAQRLLALTLVGALVAGATIVGADAPAKVAGQVRMTDGGISTDAINTTSLITSYDPKGGYNVIVTTDGTNVIARTAHGFLISNSTTASTAIQAAIDSLPYLGGRVYIGAGNYSISSTITLRTGVALVGAGYSSYLKLADNANTNMIASSGSNNQNMEIAFLHLDGNGANQASGGSIINLSGPVYARIHDNYIINSKGTAIYFSKTSGYDGILNDIVHNNLRWSITGGYAIYLAGTTDNLIAENTVQNIGTGTWETIFVRGGGTRVLDNHFVKSRQAMLTLNGTDGSAFTVMGNLFDTSYQHGIRVEVQSPYHMKNTRIIGNQFNDMGYETHADGPNPGATNVYDGINIEPAGVMRDSVISGNTVHRQASLGVPAFRYGIFLGANTYHNTITDNTVSDYREGDIADLGTRNFVSKQGPFDSSSPTTFMGSSSPSTFKLHINGSLCVENTGSGSDPCLSSGSSQARVSFSGGVQLNGDSIPATDNTRNFGANANRWAKVIANEHWSVALTTDTYPTYMVSPTGFWFGPGGSTAPTNYLDYGAANVIGTNSSIKPSTDNARELGGSSVRWSTVWAVQSRAEEIRLSTSSLDTCTAAEAGSLRYTAGGAGVADTLSMCMKNAANTYSWQTIHSAT